MSSFYQPRFMPEETEGMGSRNLPKLWQLVSGPTDNRFYENHSQVPGQHPVRRCARLQAPYVLPWAGGRGAASLHPEVKGEQGECPPWHFYVSCLLKS